MQEVKIYTASPSDLSPPFQSESFCVDVVLASDYAEMEYRFAALSAKLSMINDLMEAAEQANTLAQEAAEKLVQERNALAAENAALKYQEPKLAAMMSCLDAFYADEDVPERAMMAAYNILRKSVRIPDTDAFLAEVRAQGVEMFGSTTIKFGEEEGDEDIIYAGNQALLFAAQIRREAAQ
ncbi:TPA: hypothetical protein ACJW38_002135 [Salmonella enterica subsp. enterica serovar Thompson]